MTEKRCRMVGLGSVGLRSSGINALMYINEKRKISRYGRVGMRAFVSPFVQKKTRSKGRLASWGGICCVVACVWVSVRRFVEFVRLRCAMTFA